ncbi:hypothetical protein CWS43_18655 [Rahnella sp. AA]|uniref:hypothetical protein n=1 Tax=Rahnella sp. AA TaxID=2057180 RepID=UPI000C34E87D|nr:hypothetical protein [Rahnella sp. AA]PKE28872.1 hypothetical protein CWS43_18655 [Rahnella sp. AA]
MTINRCGLHKTDLSALLQVAIVPGKEKVARAGIKSLLKWMSVRRDRKVSFVPDLVIHALRVKFLSNSGYALIGYEYCARIM